MKPSESQRSRIRFRTRNAPKQPTRNTVAKKRAAQEDVDSDYLFGNSFRVGPPLEVDHIIPRGKGNSGNLR